MPKQTPSHIVSIPRPPSMIQIQADMRFEQFTIGTHDCVFTWPDDLNAEDALEIEQWLKLTQKKINRVAGVDIDQEGKLTLRDVLTADQIGMLKSIVPKYQESGIYERVKPSHLVRESMPSDSANFNHGEALNAALRRSDLDLITCTVCDLAAYVPPGSDRVCGCCSKLPEGQGHENLPPLRVGAVFDHTVHEDQVPGAVPRATCTNGIDFAFIAGRWWRVVDYDADPPIQRHPSLSAGVIVADAVKDYHPQRALIYGDAAPYSLEIYALHDEKWWRVWDPQTRRGAMDKFDRERYDGPRMLPEGLPEDLEFTGYAPDQTVHGEAETLVWYEGIEYLISRDPLSLNLRGFDLAGTIARQAIPTQSLYAVKNGRLIVAGKAPAKSSYARAWYVVRDDEPAGDADEAPAND